MQRETDEYLAALLKCIFINKLTLEIVSGQYFEKQLEPKKNCFVGGGDTGLFCYVSVSE